MFSRKCIISAGILLTVALFSACEDPYAPENSGTFTVELDVTGEPVLNADSDFFVEWRDVDGHREGRRSIRTEFLYHFDQVPNGPTHVILSVPSNCTAERPERTIEVTDKEIVEIIFTATCE